MEVCLRPCGRWAILAVASSLMLLLFLPAPGAALPQVNVLEIADESAFISPSPDEDPLELNATLRSPYARNAVITIGSRIEGGSGWTLDHPGQLYLEPLESWTLVVSVVAPEGETAGTTVRLVLEAFDEEGELLDSDSCILEVVPYMAAGLSSPEDHLLDMPLEGSFPLTVWNRGNVRAFLSVGVLLSTEIEIGAEGGLVEPGGNATLSVHYSLPAEAGTWDVNLVGASGEWMGQEQVHLSFFGDGTVVHILFRGGPAIIARPEVLGEENAVWIILLGGPMVNMGLELMDGPQGAALDADNGFSMESLERATVPLKAKGFEGSKPLTVRVYGYCQGSRYTSNTVVLVVKGETKARSLPSSAILISSGAAATSIMAIGAGAYLFSASEVFRYRWLAIAFIPLYSLVKGEKVLDHFFRGRLYEHIKAHPGATFTGLREHFEVNNGLLTYHLHRLEMEGLITHRNLGKYKMFYAEGVRIRGCEVVISPMDREIMEVIERTPGIPSSELLDIVGRDRSGRTVSRHLKYLERKGFIQVDNSSGVRRLYISDRTEAFLEPRKGVTEARDAHHTEVY